MSGLSGLFGPNSFKFTSSDLLKIGKSAVFVAIGAGGAYALNSATLLDWGPATPIVVAGLAWAANTLKVWVANNE